MSDFNPEVEEALSRLAWIGCAVSRYRTHRPGRPIHLPTLHALIVDTYPAIGAQGFSFNRATLAGLLHLLPYLQEGILSDNQSALEWAIDIEIMLNMADEPFRSRLIQYGVLGEHYSRPYRVIHNGVVAHTGQHQGAELGDEKTTIIGCADKEKHIQGQWDKAKQDWDWIIKREDPEFTIETKDLAMKELSPSEQARYDRCRVGYQRAQDHLLTKINRLYRAETGCKGLGGVRETAHEPTPGHDPTPETENGRGAGDGREDRQPAA